MLQPSLTQVVRAAEVELSRWQQMSQAPAVLWRGLAESPESFAMRCAGLQNRGIDRVLGAVPHGCAVPAGIQAVEFAPKLFHLLNPHRPPRRYRRASGGRGSGKSHGVATALVLRALGQPIRILCAREYQRSLRESVHRLLEGKIDALGLGRFFDINERAITCIPTGSEFIFTGLFQNASQLKSLEQVGLCWIEQAESVSQSSMEVLSPTIRDSGSEIWLTDNPTDPAAPAEGYTEALRPDVYATHMTWVDNPWFPDVLEGERVYLQKADPDAHAHIWAGECLTHSDAQVFKGKFFVEDFAPAIIGEAERVLLNRLAAVGKDEEAARVSALFWKGPYLGADFGFAVDPSTLIRCWIHKKELYIDREAWGVGVDTNKLPAMYAAVPDAGKYVIRGDSARPETISALKADGFPRMVSVQKWKGSVEDGIAFIRSFERVVIHPRCQHTIDEFRLYSYKVDRLTGDVLPDLKPGNDHLIDALRYALTPAIMHRRNARVVEFRL